MPKIIIDDQEYEVPANAMLLPAALEHGIHIPHYCWHPKLSIDGSCRMCQVEVEGSPKLVIACNTPVRDGMIVRTKTPRVENARRGVMELLLVNHPVDCPICDKAGECLLQDYSIAFGSRESRTREPKRKLQKRVDIGARMILDQERCILCRRCVRFCREITGTHELGVFNIGDRSVVDILPGKPLDNAYSINTADICPVGALESKDFHHKLRVWFLKKTPSVCPGCSNGCNITVQHYRNQVWRLMPRRNDAVNETWMCDEGRLNYGFIHDERRLRQPLIRRDGKLVAAPWEDTLSEVARILRDAVKAEGPGSVGVVASAQFTNEELFRLRQLLRYLGITNVDTAIPMGESDNLLIKAEKTANATGARELGLQSATGSQGLQSMLGAANAGRLKVLYLCGSDISRVIDGSLLEEALSKVGTLIVQDLFLAPLAERAAVVLPSTTWAEKTGTFTNIKRRVQQIHRAVTTSEQPSDGEIFSRLLSQLGESARTFDPAAVLEEIAAEVPAFNGITFAGVGSQGWVLAEPAGGGV